MDDMAGIDKTLGDHAREQVAADPIGGADDYPNGQGVPEVWVPDGGEPETDEDPLLGGPLLGAEADAGESEGYGEPEHTGGVPYHVHDTDPGDEQPDGALGATPADQ